MSTEAQARPVVDVADLPSSAMDHRSPIWWGNVLLLIIETVMFALLVAAYFYTRQNFHSWPPPQVNAPIAFYDPVPDLRVATINLVVLVLSCAPMFWADRAALHRNAGSVRVAMVIMVLVGGVTIWLRFREFGALHFKWDDNAYASLTWMLVGMHLLHLVVGTLENLTLTAWVLVKPLDDKHGRDIRVGAVYWYWIAAIWIPLYAIIFLGPRYF
jgi:cytochrome c oxidase subunit III